MSFLCALWHIEAYEILVIPYKECIYGVYLSSVVLLSCIVLVEKGKDLFSVKELRNILLFKLCSHYIAVFLFFYPVDERH